MIIGHQEIDWTRLKEYAASLERDRANLWAVNEELRLKIASLEVGSLDLQEVLNALRTPLEKINASGGDRTRP